MKTTWSSEKCQHTVAWHTPRADIKRGKCRNAKALQINASQFVVFMIQLAWVLHSPSLGNKSPCRCISRQRQMQSLGKCTEMDSSNDSCDRNNEPISHVQIISHQFTFGPKSVSTLRSPAVSSLLSSTMELFSLFFRSQFCFCSAHSMFVIPLHNSFVRQTFANSIIANNIRL